jgi:hypothetical protein
MNIQFTKKFISIRFGILIFFISVSFTSFAVTKHKHGYVGAKKCATCHKSDAVGNQYDKWLRTPHAKSLLRLQTADAVSIAKNFGIENPAENNRCLQCHTTAKGKHEICRDEGVGCESCHGPGSEFSECANHVDLIDRKSAYIRAIGLGMYPILGSKGIKAREKVCVSCHNDQRLCYPSDSKEIYRQGISLQVISDLKKGDLIIKHSLIPPFPQY